MSDSSCGRKSRGVWLGLIGAAVGLPLAGLAYVTAVPGNDIGFQLELLLSGDGSDRPLTLALADTDELKPLSPETAKLFHSAEKGPRADKYHTVKTTTYAGRQTIAASVLASAGVDASLEEVQKEAIDRETKADRLKHTYTTVKLTGALADGRGTNIFMKPTESESAFASGPDYDGTALLQWAVYKPLEEKKGSISYKGETEAEFEERERRCLATAIYFEARGESQEGQLAVAQVVMNRVRSPKFPDTVCGVVYQGQFKKGCQFSFTCDGKTDNAKEGPQWELAQKLARDVTSGKAWLEDVGYSTFYHANYVRPRWARSMNKIDTIGSHIFYKKRKEEPYVVSADLMQAANEDEPLDLNATVATTELLQAVLEEEADDDAAQTQVADAETPQSELSQPQVPHGVVMQAAAENTPANPADSMGPQPVSMVSTTASIASASSPAPSLGFSASE
ncbi:cell wall hydrolase [Methyloligella sp. 2.7D]|uniref:cell wall hydrolase n=1 Tax=unclassified Methyloligella TaxID=2625955 RepID=UPI00157C5AD2|nr:cell wall hydrolase [Methyloligella sp. GL2]QKP78284.1 cell wall hydrolase [Methyloligella sp. GL2]